jgi:hypothetical protein
MDAIPSAFFLLVRSSKARSARDRGMDASGAEADVRTDPVLELAGSQINAPTRVYGDSIVGHDTFLVEPPV